MRLSKEGAAAVYFDSDISFSDDVFGPKHLQAIIFHLGQIPSRWIQIQPSSRNQESYNLAMRVARTFVAKFGVIVENDEGSFVIGYSSSA